MKADDHLNPWAGGTDNLDISVESFVVLWNIFNSVRDEYSSPDCCYYYYFKTPLLVLSAFSKTLGNPCRPCGLWPRSCKPSCAMSHCWGSVDEGKECSNTRQLRVALLPNTYHLLHAAVSACLVVRMGCCRAPGTACGLLHGFVTSPTTRHSQPRCPPGSLQAVPEPARHTAEPMSEHGMFLAAPETGLTSCANPTAECSWVMPGQEHSQGQVLSFLTVWPASF